MQRYHLVPTHDLWLFFADSQNLLWGVSSSERESSLSFSFPEDVRAAPGSLGEVSDLALASSLTESACLSGLHSVVAIKYSNQKQLGEEQGLCHLYFQVTSRHWGKSGRSLKQKLQKKATCWHTHRLTIWLLLSQLSYTVEDYLLSDGTAYSRLYLIKLFNIQHRCLLTYPQLTMILAIS